ncbi:MAG: DUF1566 domain-containing protein, partial [Parabacteroides sp.]|nr:DUF1566 domain-containing protein [Parabacteroides sp.]
GPTGTITITQEGSVFTATGPTEKIPADGTKTVTGSVSATAGLAWTISPEESNSIKVSPIAGSGYSELTFTGEDNEGRERTGSFTVTVTANPARIASISVKQESKEVPAIVGSIEVDKIQYREKIDYNDANRYCQSKGWRIPTAAELYSMYQSRYSLMAIDGFEPFITTTNTTDYYWSCSFNTEGVIVRYFGQKTSTTTNPNYPALVRCVRNIVN